MFDNKKIIIILGIITIVLGIYSISKLEDTKEEAIKNIDKNEEVIQDSKIIPVETKLVEIVPYNNKGAKVKIDLHQDIDLSLSSNDDIMLKSINKVTNEVVDERNKSLKEYLVDDKNNRLGSESKIEAGTYYSVFEGYELQDQPLDNIAIQLRVVKDNNEVHNSTINYTKFGEDGHIDVKSVAANPMDFGIKFKWELSNLTINKKTNVKITTLDESQVLLSTDVNPMETISVVTDVLKGSKLKVHTMQGDGTYLIKEIDVDKSMIKFEDVLVEYIEGDANSFGKTIRYKVKNPNSNGNANVVIKDVAGGNILQFDLDVNNQKVVEIDVERGKAIVVETRMGDGSYSSKLCKLPKFDKEYVDVNVLEFVDNGGAGIRKVT